MSTRRRLLAAPFVVCIVAAAGCSDSPPSFPDGVNGPAIATGYTGNYPAPPTTVQATGVNATAPPTSLLVNAPSGPSR